jgi:purine-binding chemotaxis protein CheW
MTAPTAHPPSTEALATVTFQLGRQEYSLPLEEVREVVPLPALLQLAGAPPLLCGLLHRRGRYLPVLDGRILVGEPAHYDLSRQIVIAGRSQPELGLLVDQVRDVVHFQHHRITRVNEATAAAFVAGVVSTQSGAVVMLNLAALLSLGTTKQK